MSRRSARTNPPITAATNSTVSNPDLFDGLVFTLTAKAARSEPTLSSIITQAGGTVVASVSKKVTFVVALASELDEASLTGKAKTAAAVGIPTVPLKLVTESIALGKKTDWSAYTILPSSAIALPDRHDAGDGDGDGGGDGDECGAGDDPLVNNVTNAVTVQTSSVPSKRRAKHAATAISDPSVSSAKVPRLSRAKTTKGALPKAIKDQAATDLPTDASEMKENIDADEPAEDETKKHIVVVKKGRSIVDHNCPKAGSTHVVEMGDEIFDAMLNQTNISANNNKFYILQLLKEDTSSNYFVWKRWGRVGMVGQTNLSAHPTLIHATREFHSKFHDKTKNSWDSRHDFIKHPGKYFLIERDFSCDDDVPETVQDPANTTPEEKVVIPDSKLAVPVKELMELIFNMDMMERQMMEIGYDAKKMPLGKLSKSNILKGYEVLKKIADMIASTSASRHKELSNLSSEFYTIVPHEFGMSRPPVISTLPMLKNKLVMVETLADIQIAASIIKTTKTIHTEHPMDTNYHSLGCHLEAVDRSSSTFKLVCDYTRNTHGKTHTNYALDVLEVFDVVRAGEADQFMSSGNDKLPNRMLLWHGSRLTNFAGILSQGLRIAPPEAPVTGYMFGKGVYFADMVSKSANYCCTSRGSSTGILLLCEVALGTTNDLVSSDYHANSKIDFTTVHSTKGMGRIAPDPKEFVELEGGLVVPAGTSTESPSDKLSLMYNEYIVYRTDQIRIRYLVKMKFNYT